MSDKPEDEPDIFGICGRLVGDIMGMHPGLPMLGSLSFRDDGDRVAFVIDNLNVGGHVAIDFRRDEARAFLRQALDRLDQE